MLKLKRKHKATMLAVLAVLFLLVSISLLFSGEWYPRAYGDPTPTGTILKVTATPECRILLSLGVFSPWVRYPECGIILLPPGEQGGNSSGEAKLLWIDNQGHGSYNSTIQLEILLSDASGTPDFTYRHIEMNDSLVINSSMMGHIPEGRWSVYLMYLNGTMASATWWVNQTPALEQSLLISRAYDADPMLDYGLIRAPQFWEYGHFWRVFWAASTVILLALMLILGVSLLLDKRVKRT